MLRKFFGTVFMGAVLMAPTLSIAQDHDDHDRDRDRDAHRYYDREHKDWHNWDAREDRAYRLWVNDQHRDYAEWGTLPPRDQAAYWAWRHAHSDAVLHIDVR